MTLYDDGGDEIRGRLFLGGEWVQGSGGARDVVNPADGGTIGSVGLAGPDDLDRAVTAASAAQRAWADAPFDDRARVLREAGRLLEAATDEYAGWLVGEAGSAQ